jgi:hypothetical protein
VHRRLQAAGQAPPGGAGVVPQRDPPAPLLEALEAVVVLDVLELVAPPFPAA